MVDDYIDSRQDEEVQVVRQSNSEKGYEMYDHKLKVRLPTIEGFARFIGVNKTSLYEWEKKFPDFSNALDKIRIEQKERLLNYGLSGDYNSTIAKLVLSANHGMNEKTELEHSGGLENTETLKVDAEYDELVKSIIEKRKSNV